MQTDRVLLVWNADAGLRGHLHYAFQKFVRGNDECSLCELTHGSVSETPEWKACKRELGVPVDAVYRNRLSEEQARAVAGETPCVLAETPEGLVKLLGREAIEECGDLGEFLGRLRTALEVS